jgi:hypothetical protein
MFIIIGVWGSRERKVRAAYMFFLYTLIGSVFMLLSILYIYFKVGTTDYESLLAYDFNDIEQRFIFLAFFASFASKIPMLPVQTQSLLSVVVFNRASCVFVKNRAPFFDQVRIRFHFLGSPLFIIVSDC